jgi:hypothetical protein
VKEKKREREKERKRKTESERERKPTKPILACQDFFLPYHTM